MGEEKGVLVVRILRGGRDFGLYVGMLYGGSCMCEYDGRGRLEVDL